MTSIYTSCRRTLILLVLLALSLRVGFVLTLENDMMWDDARDYHQVALNVLAGNGIQLSEDAVAFRPPGYPVFLAAIYQSFGVGNLLSARLIQALLSAVVTWQVFVIGARVFRREAGLLAASLVVFDPFQVYFSGMILNETLFISLLLAMMYSVLRMQADWRWLFAAGAFAGLGTLVKPSFAYLAPFLFPFLVLAMRQWMRPVAMVAGVCVAQLVVVSPWLIRNYHRLGTPTLTTMSGGSLYEALGQGATGGPAMSVVRWPEIPEGLNEVQRDAFVKRAAIEHARENPWWALRLSVRKFCRFWSPILNFREFRTWKYNLMSAGWYVPVMVLFFVTGWRHRREWRRWVWILAPVFYFTILHSIFVGSVRYRMPILPLLCCVAGAAFIKNRHGDTATRRHGDRGTVTTLSVIVPFLNEAQTLAKVVEEVRKLPLEKEIILVDDGSTDGGGELADQLAAEHRDVRALHHETNRGKGMAIRTGLGAATGDVVVIQDADLEYNPENLVELWEPIARGEAQVVYGSRTLGSPRHSYASFYWGGQVVGWVCNLLYDSKLTDEPTCYKMIRADVLKSVELKSEGFEFCPEVTAKILRQGIVIPELPIDYRPRKFEEGKKIRWTDGLIAIWTLVRFRFAD